MSRKKRGFGCSRLPLGDEIQLACGQSTIDNTAIARRAVEAIIRGRCEYTAELDMRLMSTFAGHLNVRPGTGAIASARL
jgi:hypothetical protein